MDDQDALYEISCDGDVVGPVTIDRIRRGLAVGEIPPGAQVRRVTPWQSVALVPMIHPPPGGDRRPCIEIRHGADVVGPVSLYQVRKGLAAAKIPDGSQARVVWRWMPVERLVDKHRRP